MIQNKGGKKSSRNSEICEIKRFWAGIWENETMEQYKSWMDTVLQWWKSYTDCLNKDQHFVAAWDWRHTKLLVDGLLVQGSWWCKAWINGLKN